ncbi:MAG: BlaI/MecI/CopY family transcriptional regulator [Bdellovibrionota bacterium]
MLDKIKTKTLTEVELEMMTILWRIEPCTINQIIEKLPHGRDLAYTSVATIIRILEQKGIVKSKKENRSFIYSALMTKEEYELNSLSHLITNVFDGEPSLLVKRLLNNKNIDKKSLDEIYKLLDKKP